MRDEGAFFNDLLSGAQLEPVTLGSSAEALAPIEQFWLAKTDVPGIQP